MAKPDRLEVVYDIKAREVLPPAFLLNPTDDEGCRIITIVCRDYKERVDDVLSISRLGHLVEPRHWCMFLLRKLTGMTFKKIATYFASVDHSTIVYAVQKIEGRIEVYPTYKKKYEYYLNLLE